VTAKYDTWQRDIVVKFGDESDERHGRRRGRRLDRVLFEFVASFGDGGMSRLHTRSTFDNSDSRRSFGVLAIDYEQVQSKVTAKYDSSSNCCHDESWSPSCA
jgi:hypothetical protein